jgi:hypothetical protein
MNTDIITTMTEQEARQCVQDIRAGLVNVGRKLLDLYERDGWRVLGYTSWRECAQAEFGYRQSHTYRLLEAATIERNISPIGEIQAIPESQLRPLTALEPAQQIEAWQRAIDTAPNGKITAAHVQAVVDDMRPLHQAKPESLHVSDDSYEWFTPAEYIEAARRVMGSIDTDPASCPTANRIVKASLFYTSEDDGLLFDWPGNVWLNPPYNMPWIERFIDKAIFFLLSPAGWAPAG